MLIYRIEHKESGKGPYTSYGWNNKPVVVNQMFRHHNRDLDNKPCAWQDIDGWNSSVMFCACESLEQLEEWFDGYFDDMLRIRKLRLRVYEVNEHFIYRGRSRKQLGFIKDEAKLIIDAPSKKQAVKLLSKLSH